MIGLAYLLMFIIVWFVVSIIAVRYLPGKRNKFFIFVLIFLLPFSVDILISLYMNITISLYCSDNSGVLRKVNDKPSSFLVKAGAISYLYEKDVQFVEWQINDRYSRSRNISPDLPEGLYKAFLRPMGDEGCESMAVFYPDPEVRKRIYQWNRIKRNPLDKCVVIVKIDRLMAKYQVGKITYTEKTPYGYSVRVTDKYITNLFTGEKEGLSRNVGTSAWLPFMRFIWRVARDRDGSNSYSCSKTMQLKGWQDLFEYEKGDE
ncbi:hypothetical protein MNBD_ALPHA01-1434 [hydrothermal vent metagenome]|uniref:Uncharacterized protein n=1 Tax=hydrothermal vent metagenome TaxID=652676 RepID=A0A3B0S4R6_9ZZZZ